MCGSSRTQTASARVTDYEGFQPVCLCLGARNNSYRISSIMMMFALGDTHGSSFDKMLVGEKCPSCVAEVVLCVKYKPHFHQKQARRVMANYAH